MIRKEANRLLLEAAKLPREVEHLTGRLGLHASLEASTVGDARKIRVFRDGAEVCWMFTLEAGEARPGFYPADLPLLPDLRAMVLWDGESGLNAKWVVSGYEDRIRALARRVEEHGTEHIPDEVRTLAERMEGASPEERKEYLSGLDAGEGSPLRAWADDLFGDGSRPGLPEEAVAGLERIVEFHARMGWSVVEGEAGASSRRYELRKGPALRQLIAVSVLGIATVDLSERPGDRSGAS